MKKFLLMIALVICSIFALASCGETDNPGGTNNPGGTDNPGGTNNPGGTDNPGGTNNPGGTDNPGTVNKKEFTIFLQQDGVIYRPDMPVFQKANDYANIKLTGILQKNDTNYDTIFNLRGKNASLVVNDQDTIEAYALRDKLYVDLTPLIKQHAPNLKKFFDENPQKRAWATASDGKIYGIPFYTDGKTAKAFFVRQDWVNILANKNALPKGVTKDNLNNMTVQQFHDLLLAFKDNKKDLTSYSKIYPYFDRDSEFAISELASLWGGTAEYYLDKNNKVQYGAVMPEFRTAIDNISVWFKEGLIDPTILTSSSKDKRETYFAQNSGGATHDWLGTTYSFNDDVYAENMVDGFELVCIAPPTRSDGTKYEPTLRKQIGTVTAINAATSAEDQIQLIKWIDYFFTETGHDQLNFGIEGEHFTKNGSTYQYTNKIINDNGTALANLYNIGSQLQSPGVQSFAYEKAWLSAPASAAMEMYENNKYLNLKYNDLIYPNIKLSNADYQTINAARTAVKKVYNDQVAKWLKAGTAVSDKDWNAFVAAMEKAGTKTIVATLQKYVK